MRSSYAKQPNIWVCQINVSAQKIDSSKLNTFNIVIVFFLLDDQNKKFCFFKMSLFFSDINMDIIFGMLFLTYSNIKVNFNDQVLEWNLYITAKALSTIKNIKLVGKKKFATAALNLKNKAFVVHIASIISTSSNLIHPFHGA